MKRIINFKARLASLLLLLFCLLANSNAKAQSPTITSAYFTEDSNCIGEGYQNSAMIDYTGSCATCTGANMLTAVVDDNYFPPPWVPVASKLTISDGVNTPYCVTISCAKPDVAIANNGLHNYVVAVVYLANTSGGPCSGSSTAVFMDVYNVANPGAGSFAVSAPTTYQITLNYGNQSSIPHIDIIAQYSSMSGPGGTPLCEMAAISWTDWQPYKCGMSPAINPYYGVDVTIESLTSPTSYPSCAVYHNPTYAPYYAAIAGVERDISSVYTNYAYLTFVDHNNDLYEMDCDLATVTFPYPPTFLASNMSGYPRIAAIDDYAYNDPTGSNSVWMVTDNDLSDVVNGFYYQGSSNYNFTMGGWSPAVQDFYPVVTCGTGQNYTVSYFHDDGFNSNLSAAFSWSGAMSSPTNYYCVNYDSMTPVTFYVDDITISSTCNDDGTFTFSNIPYLLDAWNSDSHDYQKIATDVTDWKHSLPASVTNVQAQKRWMVSPNPATDYLQISSSTGIYNGDVEVSITDIAGRDLIRQNIYRQNEKINISSLLPGMYAVHIYENGNEVKVIKVVKE